MIRPIECDFVGRLFSASSWKMVLRLCAPKAVQSTYFVRHTFDEQLAFSCSPGKSTRD